jgi:metal-responsive CopG/Arc/MetJ family transcriptional regulator
MKTAVSIPDPLFREAERLTKRLRIPRSQLYARALEDYIWRQSSKGIKEALDEVYSAESSELDPVIARLQAIALGREDW